MVGKKGMTWTSTETISEARRLRMLGKTFEEIKEATGLHLASIHRYCSDIKLPKTTAQADQSATKYARQQRQLMKDEKQGSVNWPVTEEPEPEWLPDAMPLDASEFDTSGLMPDPALVSWAYQVQKRYIEEKARGIVVHGVPIAVVKAQAVTGTTYQPWSPEWWRDRTRWEATRIFTGMSTKDVAERTGISASSVSRYAKGTRTPSKGDMEKLRIAHWAALQDRLHNIDLWLCLHDYMVAHGLDPYDGDTTYSMDGALRWISGVGNTEEGDPRWSEEVTLEHLPSIAHVRSLMPVPDYRDEETILFGYTGYARTSVEEGEREEAATS